MEGRLASLAGLDDRQFRLEIRRLASALQYGMDTSFHRGPGIDYVNSRPYADGDPIQAVDWRASARTGRLFVKEFQSLRGTPIYLVVDRTASMCVGSTPTTKYAWAVRLAGAFALAALAKLSPVGLVALGRQPLYHPASRSSGRVRRWLHELSRYPLDDRTSLVDSLHRIEEALRSRAMLVILSDLCDPLALDVLYRLAQVHECVALQLQDPAERGGLDAGFLLGREAETGRTFTVESRASWHRPLVTNRDLTAAGVDHVVLPIDRPIVPQVAAFLRGRRGARRRA